MLVGNLRNAPTVSTPFVHEGARLARGDEAEAERQRGRNGRVRGEMLSHVTWSMRRRNPKLGFHCTRPGSPPEASSGAVDADLIAPESLFLSLTLLSGARLSVQTHRARVKHTTRSEPEELTGEDRRRSRLPGSESLINLMGGVESSGHRDQSSTIHSATAKAQFGPIAHKRHGEVVARHSGNRKR